jgi:hypothetical protein
MESLEKAERRNAGWESSLLPIRCQGLGKRESRMTLLVVLLTKVGKKKGKRMEEDNELSYAYRA